MRISESELTAELLTAKADTLTDLAREIESHPLRERFTVDMLVELCTLTAEILREKAGPR